MRWTAALLVPAVALLFVAGCAEVKPWQRGKLAHHSMDPNSKAVLVCDEFHNHIYDVREGATGGVGQAGGGCGCN